MAAKSHDFPAGHQFVALLPENYPIIKLLIQKLIFGLTKNPQTLGEHIRNKRLQDGLLQKDIIKQLNINIATLSHWENNRTIIPASYYPRIISFLGYCPIENYKNDGEKLKLFRKYAGLTQKQLAKKIGSDESYVCRWETMEYKITYDKELKLSKLFNTNFENVSPNYHQRIPEKLETIGDHLRKIRLEKGLSAREATRYFSLKSSSSYRAWETRRNIQISKQFHPEIEKFLGYWPINVFRKNM